MSTKIPCRIEELPFVADSVQNAFERDEESFKRTYPAKFPAGFKAELAIKSKAVDDVVKTEIPTRAIKLVTAEIAEISSSLRHDISILEGYVIDAENIKLSPSDFGIRDVRIGLDKGDTEKLVHAMGILNPNIATYLPALLEQGFTAEAQNKLNQKESDLKAKNKLQNRLESDKAQIVAKNQAKFNELWAMISLVMDRGKRIFKAEDLSKVPDYTFSHIIKKVRKTKSDNNGSESKE